MIIRKPYAFLIKYFKVIHIIIFLFILYLVFSTRNIYMFFKNYLLTGTYTYIENMAGNYINFIMFLGSIILIASFLLIYLLMKQKEKKVLYYLLGIIFYFITFILFIVFLNVFNSLEFTSLSNQSLVLYRDMALALYYLNYYFLVIAFVRGFGFNVKKFNFEKDLKELDITEEDREEIEVGSGIDFENVGNFVRKRKRNFMYYIKENSYVLTVLLVIIILLTTASITLNKLVISKVYKEGETISINELDYKINYSCITDNDFNGNTIKKNKKYLVVSFDVTNNSDNSLKISSENTRVKINGEYFYPKTTQLSKFEDFGVVYNKQSILKNSTKNYIMVFEIDNVSNTILQLYAGKEENGGEAILYYIDVSLNPYIFKDNDLGKFKLNESISLKDTYYKEGSFQINNMELLDIDNYTYSKCITADNCTEEKRTIVPKGVKKLLKIKYEKETPKNIFYYLNIESDGFSSSSDINIVTPDNYEENTVLLEVPNNVNLDNITLYFNIHGSKIRVTK